MSKSWLGYGVGGLAVLALAIIFILAIEPQLSVAPPTQIQASADSPAALVDQYCVVCHNETLKTGGLELDSISADSAHENPEIWEKVLRKLRANAMPPSGLPRPDAAAMQNFVAYLEESLDGLAQEAPDPGRTPTFSRLNRTEYQNAIRDMLALEIDVSGMLPVMDLIMST